jgi:hypothetical protein
MLHPTIPDCHEGNIKFLSEIDGLKVVRQRLGGSAA